MKGEIAFRLSLPNTEVYVTQVVSKVHMGLNMFQSSLLVQYTITISQLSFMLYYYIILIRNMFRLRTKSHHHAK
jgi:hypothetical protein